MGTIGSQITSLTIVYSTVYSDADQKKTPKLRVTGLWWRNHAKESLSDSDISANIYYHGQIFLIWLICNKIIGLNDKQEIIPFDKKGTGMMYCRVYTWYWRNNHTSAMLNLVRSRYSPVGGTACETSTLAVLRTIFMMISSNGNIFRVTGHMCGEFTGPGEFPSHRAVTRSFNVFFDMCLNKRLSKQ